MAKTLRDFIRSGAPLDMEEVKNYLDEGFSKFYLANIAFIPSEIPDVVLKACYNQGTIDVLTEVKGFIEDTKKLIKP